ncbi:MAG: hypothetical protein ACK4RS_05110, partial [Thiothrix sp.]
MLTLSLLISLGVTWAALCLLKPVAHRASLLDIPQGRKQHDGKIPLIGGMAIFSGIAVATLLTLPSDTALTTWL